jgi:hypothetical protein
MPFADRLVHSLTLVHTPVVEGSLDDYGQPVAAEPVSTPVRGFVAPGRSREAAEVNQAGALPSDAVIYLPIDVAVIGADHLDRDDGTRYDVTGIRTYDFGVAPHHELDVRKVDAPAPDEAPAEP